MEHANKYIKKNDTQLMYWVRKISSPPPPNVEGRLKKDQGPAVHTCSPVLMLPCDPILWHSSFRMNYFKLLLKICQMK